MKVSYWERVREWFFPLNFCTPNPFLHLTFCPLWLSDSSSTLTVWLLTHSHCLTPHQFLHLSTYQLPTNSYLSDSQYITVLLVRLSSPHPISLSDSSLTPKFDSSATTNYYLQYLTPRPLSLSDSLPIRTIWLHTLSQYLTPHPYLHASDSSPTTNYYLQYLTPSIWLLTHFLCLTPYPFVLYLTPRAHTLSQYLTPHPLLHLNPYQLSTPFYLTFPLSYLSAPQPPTTPIQPPSPVLPRG